MSQEFPETTNHGLEEESIFHQFITGTKETRKYFYPAVALIGLAVIVTYFLIGGYLKTVLYVFYMYAALALFWNSFSGYSGYIMFGVTLFYGLSAYSTAALVVHTDIHWVAALLAGAVTSTVAAVFIGYVLLRLSGVYFAIGTFMLMEGIVELIYYENEVTGLLGGSSGLVVQSVSIELVYFVFAAFMLVGLIYSYELGTSKFGMRLMAVRDDEEALASLGVNPLKYTLPAFVATAFFMAMLGSFYVMSLGFVYPNTPFRVFIIVLVILATILGGMGTVWGPLLGLALLYPMRELLWESFPNLYLVLYGIVLIGVVLALPKGIIQKAIDKGYLPDRRFL